MKYTRKDSSTEISKQAMYVSKRIVVLSAISVVLNNFSLIPNVKIGG
jgi:hypothetical protein